MTPSQQQRAYYDAQTRVAAIFSEMQLVRGELLMAASEMCDQPAGHLIIRLAQLLETGKEAMKGEFMAVTSASAGALPKL
jgi:hypothetical protein